MFKNSMASNLLVILQNLNTGAKTLLSDLSTFNYKWVRYSRRLDMIASSATAYLYRIIFSATLNATAGAFVDPYIALDDLSFSSQCTIRPGPVPTVPSQTGPPPSDNCTTITCIQISNPLGVPICLNANMFCKSMLSFYFRSDSNFFS